jgi:hypothetical protein
MGTKGVPLDYTIHDNIDPPPGAPVFPTYEEEVYSLAPLTGDYFVADAR